MENTAGNARRCHPDRRIHPAVHPGNRDDVFIWQNFQPAYRDLGWKKPRSREPSQPALSYEHIENFYKGFRGEARSRKPSQPGQPGSYEEALK